MPCFPDHPLRYDLANELHARPFPAIRHTSQAAIIALKPKKKSPPPVTVTPTGHI